MRAVVIAGGPRTGKSKIAERIGGENGLVYRSTDDLIGQYEWSALSEEVARWLDAPEPQVIEGVRTVHALRKWMASHEGAPCEYVLWLSEPKEPLTPGQASMTKGVQKIWTEILPELRRRGVKVFTETEGELA